MRHPRALRALAAAAAALALAAPAGARAGDEVLAVVVDRGNPAAQLSLEELRAVFLGKRRVWDDGARIVVIDLEPGRERATFNRAALGMTQPEVDRYWVEQRVRGAGAAPKVAPSPASAVRLVAKVRGAVAYVPLAQVDPSVKVLAIAGAAPGTPGYPLVAR